MTRALDTAKIQQNSGGSVAPFIAGKNKIINGDFAINQRNFTSTTASGYMFDRWSGGGGGGGTTWSAQTFTPGSAPVTGYEGRNFFRCIVSGQSATGDYVINRQFIEDVRTLAGQTITLSFWAKASSGTPNIGANLYQYFGTGGSPSTTVEINGISQAITTSWTRYSFTFNIPSISGKTIGTNNDHYLALRIWLSAGSTYNTISGNIGNQNNTFDIWGVQVESGSQLTPFTTATGNIGSELLLCKRYYERQSASSTQGYAPYAAGYFNFATAANYAYKFESEKRVQPTVSFGPSVAQFQAGFNGNQAQTANTLTAANISRHGCYITLVPNGTPFTAGQATTLQDAGSAVSYIEISAEL